MYIRPKIIVSMKEWASLEGHIKILYEVTWACCTTLFSIHRASCSATTVPTMLHDEDDRIHPFATHIMTRICRAAESRQVLTQKENAPAKFFCTRTNSEVVQSTSMTEPLQSTPQVTPSARRVFSGNQGYLVIIP